MITLTGSYQSDKEIARLHTKTPGGVLSLNIRANIHPAHAIRPHRTLLLNISRLKDKTFQKRIYIPDFQVVGKRLVTLASWDREIGYVENLLEKNIVLHFPIPVWVNSGVTFHNWNWTVPLVSSIGRWITLN